MIIFINGKQKRVPRPPTIHGLPVDEFIRQNADPIWLHQNGMWELMPCDDNDYLPLDYDQAPCGDDQPSDNDDQVPCDDDDFDHLPLDDREIPF